MRQGNTVFVTQAEYARHRRALGLSGGTREAVRKAVKKKCISVCNGMIDPTVADVEWTQNIRARATHATYSAKPQAGEHAAATPDDERLADAVQTLALPATECMDPSRSESSLDDEPIELLARVAAGSFDALALNWVRRGMAVYMRAGGAVQLELCLGLPNTTKRRQLIQRNAWLAEAAKHMPNASYWMVAVELAAKLDSFLSRGPWNAWRHLPGPPSDASKLRTALYQVAKANNGKSLSAKQIYRVIGHE